MNSEQARFVQEQLNAQGLNAGPVDGILGRKSLTALNQVPGMPADFSTQRKAVAFIQLLAKKHDIETGAVDGYWGPQTEFAFEALQDKLVGREPEIWRPEEIPEVNPQQWPRQTPQSELERFFGAVGQNQTRIQVPYPHKLAWATTKTVNSFSCHEKVHDSLHRVLSRVLDYYGQEEITRLGLDLWGGCLNVRKMRGGSRYSMHSWGIALDYDPARNRLKWGRDRASFAKPEYNMWWKFWEEEGWVSLGRQRNFDWMHVQAARI